MCGSHRTADIVQVAASLDQGVVQLFTPANVGTSTDFNDAPNAAFDALETKAGRRVVFLLTDGFGSLSNATISLVWFWNAYRLDLPGHMAV